MLKTRVIPSLLLSSGGLVKTRKFGHVRYVGDPINAIKIFNDKEVDELVVLDIEATKRGYIDFNLLARINKEAFMPLGYGGGIKTVDDVKRILQLGYEKVVINSAAIDDPDLIKRIANACGSQSVVCCIDIKRSNLGIRQLYNYRKNRVTKILSTEWAKICENSGAGEILLYSVDNDGMYSGYDLDGIREVTTIVNIPVIALGGAHNLNDFANAVKKAGASAVSAGSMFVFHGPYQAVLISYPSKKILSEFLF